MQGLIKHVLGSLTSLLSNSHGVVCKDRSSDLLETSKLAFVEISQIVSHADQAAGARLICYKVNETEEPLLIRLPLPSNWSASEIPAGQAFRTAVQTQVIAELLENNSDARVIALTGHAIMRHRLATSLKRSLDSTQLPNVEVMAFGVDTVKAVTGYVDQHCGASPIQPKSVFYRLDDNEPKTDTGSSRPFMSPPRQISMPSRSLRVPSISATADDFGTATMLFTFDTCVYARAKEYDRAATSPLAAAGCLAGQLPGCAMALKSKGITPVFLDLAEIRREVGLGNDTFHASFQPTDPANPSAITSETVYDSVRHACKAGGIQVQRDDEQHHHCVLTFRLFKSSTALANARDIYDTVSAIASKSPQLMGALEGLQLDLSAAHDELERDGPLHRQIAFVVQELLDLSRKDRRYRADLISMALAAADLVEDRIEKIPATQDDLIQLSCLRLTRAAAKAQGVPVVAVLVSVDQNMGITCRTIAPTIVTSPVMTQSQAKVSGGGALLADSTDRDLPVWGGHPAWKVGTSTGEDLADLLLATAAPLIRQQRVGNPSEAT